MLRGRYGIGWMIVSWLALALLLGVSIAAAIMIPPLFQP